MRHVGGEGLDGVHPVRQGLGHGLQRPGQIADLVLAALQIRQGDGPRALQSHLVRRRRQPHHRPGHEQMHQQRPQQIHEQRHQGEGHQGPALGGQGLVDVAGLKRQHAQNLLHMTHRDGDGHHPVAAFRKPQGRLRLAVQRRFDLGREGGAGAVQTRRVAALRVKVRRGRRRAGGQGRGQGLTRNHLGHIITVGDRYTVDVKQADPLAGQDKVVA